jgi:hypothetical protein
MRVERRLVDPVHFFNSSGLGLVTEDFLLKKIDDLLEENKRLGKIINQAKQKGFIENV